MLELLVGLGLLVVAIGFPLVMVRGLRQMWRASDRPGTFSSGVAGALVECERFVRPSIAHVVEAKHSVKKQEEGIGGE